MPDDKKDNPAGQDRQQQQRPAASANDNGGGNRGDEKFLGGEIHKWAAPTKFWVEIVVVVAALITIPLGIMTWAEGKIDNAVEAKTRSVLSDPTILRKIAAESRPSLIFNGAGAILQDMGAVQYVKPDDIRVLARDNEAGINIPIKLHIGFVRPVAFSPIVTSLRNPASIIASHEKGLDWDFIINWTVITTGDTNDSDCVFRLELVP